MDFRDLTAKDIELQKKLIREYRNRAEELPEGLLKKRVKGTRAEYYQITDRERYISAGNEKTVEGLKLRRYFQAAIMRMEKNVAAEEKLLTRYKPYGYDDIQQALPAAYRMEISGADQSCRSERTDTCCPPPDDNWEYRERGRGHTTSTGHRVRSKSEMLICDMLDASGIRYEYEKPLKLRTARGEVIWAHPDYTFYGRFGQVVYWEHFGMLGEPEYRAKALKKMDVYIVNGVIPSVNLIITAESLDGKLDGNSIRRSIDLLKDMLMW